LLSKKALNLISLFLIITAVLLGVLLSQRQIIYSAFAVFTGSFPSLPDTTNNIHVGLPFNFRINNPQDEKGKVDFVWGSSWPGQPPGVYNTYYYPYDREPSRGHTISWFQKNHPDWIEYHCDRKTIAYEFGQSRAPLDITNPAVLSYMESTYLAPNLKSGSGYQGIAFDNPNFQNAGSWTGQRCGHFDSSGKWVAQFNGTQDDPAYRQAIIQWAKTMQQWIHSQFPGATMGVNFSFDFLYPSDSNTLLSEMDIDSDEDGFTNGNNAPPWYYADSFWLSKMQALQNFLSAGHGLFSINQESVSFSHLTHGQVQWALANYLLIKNNASYINITGYQEYGKLDIRPEYSAPIGYATSAMYPSQNGYMRDFSNGKAIVNPSSSKTITISLPANTYQDLYGHIISQPFTLAPHSGIVLLNIKG
jgi:hypothetical protein